MQTKQVNIPLDVGYILGLSGPSQGTSRTDNVANVTLKNTLCGAIAEATNIRVTITELPSPSGSNYAVALEMDVKSLGTCKAAVWDTPRVGTQMTASIVVEIRNVNRGLITVAAAFRFPSAVALHRFTFRTLGTSMLRGVGCKSGHQRRCVLTAHSNPAASE